MTVVVLVQHAENEPVPGDPGLTPGGRERVTRTAAQSPASGYSSRDAAERMFGALRDLANRHRDEVVVVTHGDVKVDLLRTLLGDEAIAATAPDLLSGGEPSCALTTLTRDDDVWFVHRIASAEHPCRWGGVQTRSARVGFGHVNGPNSA